MNGPTSARSPCRSIADPAGRLAAWARGFVRGSPTDTLAMLKDLHTGVPEWVRYQSREEEGTQTPLQTLDRGWGSCRDLAVLFVEAARSLGLGARIISGYFYNPDRQAAVGRIDPCLGGNLSAGRRLDHLRSDQPQCRRLQSHSRGRGPRYRAGDAGDRQFRRDDRRFSGHVGRGRCHVHAAGRVSRASRGGWWGGGGGGGGGGAGRGLGGGGGWW